MFILKKSFKRAISTSMSLALSLSLITNFVYATDESEKAETEIKMSAELVEQFENKDENLVMIYVSNEPKKRYFNILDITYDEDLLNELSTSEEVQNFIETKRAVARNTYSNLNNDYANKYLSDYDVVYVSKYSPVIIAKMNYSQVKKVSKNNFVQNIEYYDTSCGDCMDISTQIVGSDVTYDNYGYDGSGIKIGQLEQKVPRKTNRGLQGANIVNHPNGEYMGSLKNDHPSMVANILVGQPGKAIATGIAPKATLYCAPSGSKGTTGYIDGIEWLLDQGVNVINASCYFGGDYIRNDDNSESYSVYGSTSKWLDHIAINHYVHFVQSAGNFAGLGICSGSMAYNITSVGSLNTKGSLAFTDDEIDMFSSYTLNDAEHSYVDQYWSYKPDICAPGTNVTTSGGEFGIDGSTSAAAPHVAGIIALMCQAKPTLKTKPQTVKAILASGVNRNSPFEFFPTNRSSTTPSYLKYGAGLTNASTSCNIATRQQYLNGEISSSSNFDTQTINITKANANVRLSLAFLCNSKFGSGVDHGTVDKVNTNRIADLKLKVYSPSGVLIAQTDTKNNIEILEFNTSYGTGNYQVMIEQNRSAFSSTKYSLAWRI